jgi:hypothetical protein
MIKVAIRNVIVSIVFFVFVIESYFHPSEIFEGQVRRKPFERSLTLAYSNYYGRKNVYITGPGRSKTH